jgi:hypothetical protein
LLGQLTILLEAKKTPFLAIDIWKANTECKCKFLHGL